MTTETSRQDLLATIELHRRTGDETGLAEALRDAQLYGIRAERPGFVTGDPPWSQFVALFTSLQVMARTVGRPVGWFRAPGRELADLLPEPYNFVLDPGTDHALQINPTTMRTERSEP